MENEEKILCKVRNLERKVRCLGCNDVNPINLGAALVADTTKTNTIQFNDNGDIWFVTSDGTAILLAGGTTVNSVFGRTGIVTAQANDYTFAQLASKPTTLAGYGIVDASPLIGSLSITTLGTIGTGTWHGTVIDGQYGGTGVNNAGKTITLANNLVTSGNFSLTFTQTGTTNVTLPTTGTLATLAGSESLTNKKLGSLTTNGFVKTGSGDGTLSVDASIYITNKVELLAYAALGSVIKFEAIGSTSGNLNNTITLTDNQLVLIPVYITAASTITGVKWLQSTAGSYTADNYNGVGLYSYSAGTLTLVASSTDDGNIWKASNNTFNNKAFSSTYAAAVGIYFIGVLYNSSVQVTAPVIRGGNSTQSAGSTADFTNSAKLFGTATAGANTLTTPLTMANVTASTGNPYAALY